MTTGRQGGPSSVGSGMVTLKLLTLNCWGVPTPVVCKYRKERMEAIGEEVAGKDYDVVMLQEVWSKSDYEILCQRICKTMPHTHYFYSGVIGSGLCVFSKVPIVDTLFFQYHLNGIAHKIHHGDWFGGKGIGLCKIIFQGLHINLFTTHMHAEYNRDNDEYLAHRLSQAFQISQFVKYTSELCDIVVLGGDLNLEPTDLGYKIIKTNAMLFDAWEEKKTEPVTGIIAGYTSETPGNSFTSPSALLSSPSGKRIDYILYRPSTVYSVAVESCCTAMGNIPGQSYSYSDHEAVSAVMTIGQTTMNKTEHKVDISTRNSLLKDADAILDTGLKMLKSSKLFFFSTMMICFIIHFSIAYVECPHGLECFLILFKYTLILLSAYGLWAAVVINKSEMNGIKRMKADIKILLQSEKQD